MAIKIIPPNNSVKFSRLEELKNIHVSDLPPALNDTLSYTTAFGGVWRSKKLPTLAIDSTGDLTVDSLTIQPGIIRLYEDFSTDWGYLRFERTGRKLQYNPNDGTGNIDIGSHGLSGTFTTTDGKTVTYTHGFITSVV